MIMKNRFMRAAMLILALVLVSTCAVGGTFAKYQTTGNDSESARVAKWGVEIENNNFDLFNTKYDIAEANTAVGQYSVSAEAEVVAPGTTGTLTSLSVSGTPEVAVSVTYDAELTLANWAVENNAYYCPIVITVGGENGTSFKGSDYESMTTFEAAVEAEIEKCTADYAPNTALTNVAAPVVSWSWAYGTEYANDTYLGDQAANNNAATIALTITATITQID